MTRPFLEASIDRKSISAKWGMHFKYLGKIWDPLRYLNKELPPTKIKELVTEEDYIAARTYIQVAVVQILGKFLPKGWAFYSRRVDALTTIMNIKGRFSQQKLVIKLIKAKWLPIKPEDELVCMIMNDGRMLCVIALHEIQVNERINRMKVAINNRKAKAKSKKRTPVS